MWVRLTAGWSSLGNLLEVGSTCDLTLLWQVSLPALELDIEGRILPGAAFLFYYCDGKNCPFSSPHSVQVLEALRGSVPGGLMDRGSSKAALWEKSKPLKF